MTSPSVAAQSVEQLGGRPHAVVSRRPPGTLLSGTLLSGLPLSALDRSRDVLDRAARTTPALAAPLRRGEDPSTSTDRAVRR